MIRTASITSLTLVAALSVGLKPAAAGIEDDMRWGASPVPHLVPADTAPPPAKAAAKKHPRPSDSKASRKADAPVKVSGPMHIVVSLAKQRVTLYADGHPVASSPASTGMPGHPTPVGVFSVIQKDRHHFSNIYGAAMPYMQRITWSGSALHEGPLPGHPASHGCIRLTSSFAQLLWKTTKIGVRVIVTRDDVAPVEISMANPFAPKPKMVDGPALTTLIKTADATGSVTPGIVTAAPAQPAETTPEPPATSESAPAALAATTDAASATEQAAKAVQAPVAEGAADVTPRPVADVVPKPDTDTIAAPAPTKRAENATADNATDRIPMIEPAPVSFDGMRPAEPAKPVTDERPAATELVPLPIPAPGLRNAMRSKDPVSIFISRKEAKLYVRQKMQPLFDAPVTFQRPDQPVGTHIFTAMAATDDDEMRWTVISIPSNLKRGASHHPVTLLRKGHHGKAVQVVAEKSAPLPDPHSVFERIVMPPDAVERISALFIPGSSIIVSDNKLSGETGEYTEFIVETP